MEPEVVDADPTLDDLLDKEDPRSLYNIVPHWMKVAMDACDPKVLMLPEQRLREVSRADARLNRIRMAFWAEYEEAQSLVKNMDFYQITNRTGISGTYLKQYITQSQYTLAFVLNQPVEYSTFLEEALTSGLGRLREMLDMPFMDPSTGEPDHKMMELILKATAFIDLRVHGGITEKRVSVNMNQNHHTHSIEPPGVFSSKADRTKSARLLTGNGSAAALEALDAKIKELESKQEYMQARSGVPEPEPITVEAIRGTRSPEKGGKAIDKLLSRKSKASGSFSNTSPSKKRS